MLILLAGYLYFPADFKRFTDDCKFSAQEVDTESNSLGV